MKCLNVIIYYDNKNEVQEYISRVCNIGKEYVDIALVINKNTLEELGEMIETLHRDGCDNFKIYDYGRNVGYLNALLYTIRDINIDEYQYIILSNTDIRYSDEHFFVKLQSAEYPPEVGCIAPSVYVPYRDSYSNPHYVERVPREKLKTLVKIFTHPWIAKQYLKLSGIKSKGVRRVKQESQYVYSPHGCYMVFSSAFIQRIKGFEYGVLMYSEESCIGELLTRNGMKCYYDSTIEVEHLISSVTGKINYKKRFNAWKDSIIYILNEFYSDND